MPPAFRMIPILLRRVFTSSSKSAGTVLVLRSWPIWPEMYRVPSTRIPGLKLAVPPANSGGETTFFSAASGRANKTRSTQRFRMRAMWHREEVAIAIFEHDYSRGCPRLRRTGPGDHGRRAGRSRADHVRQEELAGPERRPHPPAHAARAARLQIGRASCRER